VVAPNLRRARVAGIAMSVGEPGIGKSGTLAELARRRGGAGSDLVVLRVEDVEPSSQVTLAAGLRIDRPLADVLAAWPVEAVYWSSTASTPLAAPSARHSSPQSATSCAARPVGGSSPRYDHDLQQRLFAVAPGTPAPDTWREPEFAAVEHARVGRLRRGRDRTAGPRAGSRRRPSSTPCSPAARVARGRARPAAWGPRAAAGRST
jgi:hypothetical protein